MVEFRRYLLTLTTALCGFVLFVASANVFVDPYMLFDVVRLEGFNDIKSRAGQRGVVVRRQLISAQRPRALIVGNSRAEVGFDPRHPSWRSDVKPVVNAAVPGAGVGVARRMVEHAFAVGRPAVLIVGLDFVDFRVKSDSSDRAEILPRSGDPPRWDVGLREYLSAGMTVDALSDSILTVVSQRNRYSEMVTSDGFNPMLDYIRIAKTEGYGTLFLQRNRENARIYYEGPKEVVPVHGRSEAVRNLMALIEVARSRDTEVHLVIYPYHAHILELFRMTGLWPAFERWKRELVEVVAAFDVDSDRPPIRLKLWDFSGYSQYATEPVPKHGDRKSVVQWYWEAGHFKKELGDVLLKRVLAGITQDSTDSFGVVLSRQNIDRHLEEIEAQGRRYRSSQSDEVGRLTEIVESLRSAKKSQ